MEQKMEQEDPYAYLDRGDFTSEKYKISLRGLPRYYGIGELKKLLNEKLKLGSNKLKPPARGKNSYNMYVCFRSEEDCQNALIALDGYTWKNKKLKAQIAKPVPDPLLKIRQDQSESDGNKRKEHSEEGGENKMKKPKLDDSRSQDEKLKDATTPFWKIPYEEQIENKQKTIKQILVQLGHQMLRLNSSLKPWLDQQKAKYNGLPCELWDVRKSPVLNGYRNKCEFSIGINEETKERTVGFRLGSYVNGFVGIAPVDNLLHVPQRMKDAAKVFQKFVQSSEFDVFNPINHNGCWRQLTARLSMSSDELMLVVGVHPQTYSEEQLNKIKTDLREFFENGEGKECKVASLYFQHIFKRKPGEDLPPLEHLYGETHIHETVHGLKFRVSPQAFFQINTAAAEVLYTSISELSSLTQDTALLDICCGTGTIGLCLAKECGQVLGLELVEHAVNDAKTNATANNITNCEFFAGSAEDIISSVINRCKKDDIVAVVDPPRAGLRQKALVQLRHSKKLNKLVFASCDPKAALNNLAQLSCPISKTYHGSPFVPVRAVPVDMFPHTAHCELLLYFERLDYIQKCHEGTENLTETDKVTEKETSTGDVTTIAEVENSTGVENSSGIENSTKVENATQVIKATVIGNNTSVNDTT